MDVRELNYNELYELKRKIFYFTEEELEEYADVWDDDVQLNWERAQCPSDISDKTVYKIFGHIDFCEEDFWCNC